jgi:DNA-binding response OmpR family regulator
MIAAEEDGGRARSHEGRADTMKVLLVEDDAKTAQFVRKALLEMGHVVHHAADGEMGLELALAEQFDAAVVDVMLPKVDGLSLIRELRAQRVSTPVIVLSAKSAVEDRISGLKAGGDDYLVKPFALSELAASAQLTVAGLLLDLPRRKVSFTGKEIDLQPREYALLEYLMRNTGRVVTKSMIMEHVWSYNFDPQTNVVEARICRLREKIGQVTPRKLIHTIRGVGYVLEERP